MLMDRKNDDKFASSAWKYTGVGFELGGSVAIFTIIGYFIDRQWGTTPKGVLIGAILGIIVGLYLLIKEAIIYQNADAKDKFRGPGDNEGGDENQGG
jgi:F0F1-type ATP synthase assembly protein I